MNGTQAERMHRSRPTGRRVQRSSAHRLRRGFSLIELIVVITVTMMLAAILMPALKGVREHTDRLISASNMRQIGMAMTMYDTDNRGSLPASALARHENQAMMQEMMATRLPFTGPDLLHGPDAPPYASSQVVMRFLTDAGGWEGIGLLHHRRYIDTPDVLYCPAHRGDHRIDRYYVDYVRPEPKLIYANYHYRGDFSRVLGRRITLNLDAGRVLITDGMRTKRDFNHRIGYNSLLGDGSVFWRFDADGQIYSMLPDTTLFGGGGGPGAPPPDVYEQVWMIIDDMR